VGRKGDSLNSHTTVSEMGVKRSPAVIEPLVPRLIEHLRNDLQLPVAHGLQT